MIGVNLTYLSSKCNFVIVPAKVCTLPLTQCTCSACMFCACLCVYWRSACILCYAKGPDQAGLENCQCTVYANTHPFSTLFALCRCAYFLLTASTILSCRPTSHDLNAVLRPWQSCSLHQCRGYLE